MQFGHPQFDEFRINSHMGITNANFMKAAASGTWIGDFVTAWMVNIVRMLFMHLYILGYIYKNYIIIDPIVSLSNINI